MKATVVALAALEGIQAETSPVGKVISMISELQGKVIKEGEVVQKEYEEFAEWCEDRNRDLGFEIKTGNSDVESLKAAIGEEEASIQSLTAKVEDLVADIAKDEADLKAATGIRETEAADFAAVEKELSEQIGMLERAIGILEKEMKKGGASMMQLQNAGSVVEAVSAMVQASLIGSADGSKLTALVQDSHRAKEEDDDDAPGAPAAAVYESKSGGLVDTMEDLLSKAQGELDAARKQETSSRNEYEMLKQSLDDEIKFGNKEKGEAQKGIAESTEKKSKAEGELEVTSKDLAEDVKAKESLHSDCMSRASAFETETKSRGEELGALAKAKSIIEEAMSSASASFIQVSRSRISSRSDLKSFEAVRYVRDLAHKHESTALAQLAAHMASALQSGAGDPFAKVKSLVADMIKKLEKEAEEDATKKAYCDKELAETNAKKDHKTDKIEALTTKIEQMTAKSAKLKEEVATLQNELSKLAKSQAEMDKLRTEEKAIFDENSAEVSKGLKGVQKALKVLNDYYAQAGAHGSSDGAASGIIGLLEVVEADLSKNLAEMTTEEEAAVAEYEKQTKENQIEKTTKDGDVKYKTKESKELAKTAAELSSDRSSVQEELDAVMEYLKKIEAECIAKAETYEDRVARREAEIAGLKDALQILDSEAAFVQKRVIRRTLRGSA